MSQLNTWELDHAFGQDRIRPGERRIQIVIVLTLITMVIEIVAGLVYGSMALLADGLHMGTHAAALTIAAMAYVIARRFAKDKRFNFGTGKINALGGFASALLLAVFAVPMIVESVRRLLNPGEISFDQALIVAVLGLFVNGVSVLILDVGDDHDHEHGASKHHDHNLRGAYFHVLADALTSFMAIFALLAGKYFGWLWMDALMGIVGALIILHWARGLGRVTSAILLDRQAPESVHTEIRTAVEEDDNSAVVDLHVWAIGPGIHAAEIVIVAREPLTPRHYKSLIPSHLGLVHTIVEVNLTD